MDDTPAIDPEALDRLREWGGDKLLSQMVRLFLENSAKRMDQIRAGAEGDDTSEANDGAHSLKSSAANVGATEVRRLAADIEAAASQGDHDTVQGLLPELETAYAGARAALETFVEGHPE